MLANAEDPEEIWHIKKRRIAELTQNQREILLDYYIQDRTIPQIAEDQGCN